MMFLFSRNGSVKNYREFKKVFSAISGLQKQVTTQELDMAAGYLLGMTHEKRRKRNITHDQKIALEEMIESVWNECREELENEDELEEQLAEQVERHFRTV